MSLEWRDEARFFSFIVKKKSLFVGISSEKHLRNRLVSHIGMSVT